MLVTGPPGGGHDRGYRAALPTPDGQLVTNTPGASGGVRGRPPRVESPGVTSW